jgi:hypothetical protein
LQALQRLLKHFVVGLAGLGLAPDLQGFITAPGLPQGFAQMRRHLDMRAGNVGLL